MWPYAVSETDNRAAPVIVLDLSLQNWGKFFGVRSGISRGGEPHAWLWLGSARVPSSCPLEEGAAGNPPAWHAFREAHTTPSMSFQERADTSLDQLWTLRLLEEITQTSELSSPLGLALGLHPVFYLLSPVLARILLSPFMEKPPTLDIRPPSVSEQAPHPPPLVCMPLACL